MFGASGEPYVWLAGSGLAVALLMVVGLLSLVLFQGARTFWPRPLWELTLSDGSRWLGEVTRSERYRPSEAELQAFPAAARARIVADGGWSRRRLLHTGNYDLYGDDFRWVPDASVSAERRPADAWALERLEWGPAFGVLEGVTRDGAPLRGEPLQRLHAQAVGRREQIRRLERRDVGAINARLERLRLDVRAAALDHGEGSARHVQAAERAAAEERELGTRFADLQARIEAARAEDARIRLVVHEVGGRLLPERPGTPDEALRLSQVVRAYPANALGFWQRLRIYGARWGEFLSSEPREANTEGGVLPAIFGTFLMTVIMSLLVAPFGVIAALYLREYARQGALVSVVRIAVNNLAGVPSIVFGVFGLGFFCYLVGGRIDALFYPERLPAPTFGTGGILWASLTLALLTVPVVIVATEEALAAVPRSLREGSLACGASRWQTIRRIILPRAISGVMTGLILAMARGAGEVAPLMLTGVVKLAPDLPFDGRFPFFHLERSFMHLGFHIYDVGFQSRNSEAGKPMVFTTTLLLIALVALLNLAAIALRTRLRRRHVSAHF
ncbi:MAG TPA: phosphate ABC transporter permease PstA [Candidatus Polarisedimenticolaceae bacterium]|nr:phosphate ABC transporter permease PstA [Candidatus Polarisedimenticolaceae bacterium]